MNLSLNYQRFSQSGEKNMGIGKSEFVTKTQFLSKFFQKNSFIRLKKKSSIDWCH